MAEVIVQRTSDDDYLWAKGYAAAKEAFRAELEWQRDEIERLRAALTWYADRGNYEAGQDCEDILIDGGAIARTALEHEK